MQIWPHLWVGELPDWTLERPLAIEWLKHWVEAVRAEFPPDTTTYRPFGAILEGKGRLKRKDRAGGQGDDECAPAEDAAHQDDNPDQGEVDEKDDRNDDDTGEKKEKKVIAGFGRWQYSELCAYLLVDPLLPVHWVIWWPDIVKRIIKAVDFMTRRWGIMRKEGEAGGDDDDDGEDGDAGSDGDVSVSGDGEGEGQTQKTSWTTKLFSWRRVHMLSTGGTFEFKEAPHRAFSPFVDSYRRAEMLFDRRGFEQTHYDLLWDTMVERGLTNWHYTWNQDGTASWQGMCTGLIAFFLLLIVTTGHGAEPRHEWNVRGVVIRQYKTTAWGTFYTPCQAQLPHEVAVQAKSTVSSTFCRSLQCFLSTPCVLSATPGTLESAQ